MNGKFPPPVPALRAALLSVVVSAACGQDRVAVGNGQDAPSDPATGDPAEGAPTRSDSEKPLYALHVLVFDPDFNATSYVLLSDTLDLSEISLADAREFPGWVTIAALGGRLLVASEGDPRITRYEFDDERNWIEGESLSFANQGVQDAGFGRQWLLDEHTAYTELEVTKRVVWDPTDFVIRGVMEDSSLPLLRDGLEIEAGLNRQVRLHQGPVLRPFYYLEKTDGLVYAPTSQIAVYDPVTHEERAVVDAPCPGLHVGTQDELGNTYFGLWDALPRLALFGEGPEPCVARLKLDGTLDSAWAPDLTSWTGGRFVMVFRYVRRGKALANVLHQEELSLDPAAGYTEDVGAQLDEAHYRVWSFDLDRQTARPVQGMDHTAFGFHASDLDDRSFVFLPDADYGRTRVYEVDMDTATATQRFETTGWVYEWVRVR